MKAALVRKGIVLVQIFCNWHSNFHYQFWTLAECPLSRYLVVVTLYEFVYDDWGTDNPVQACKTHNALDEQLTVTTINDSSICKSKVRSCSCILSVVAVAYSSRPQERLPELMTTVQQLQPSTLVKLSGQTPCLIYHNALESGVQYRLCRLWRGNQLRVRLNAVTAIRTLSDKS